MSILKLTLCPIDHKTWWGLEILFSWPWRILIEGTASSLNINHCVLSIFEPKVTLIPKLNWSLSAVGAGTLLVLIWLQLLMDFNILARSSKFKTFQTIWQNTKYKLYSKDKKQQNAIYFSLLLTFNKNSHFARKQSFGQNLASVWKDYLAIRFSGKYFQMWRLKSLALLPLNVKWLNFKALYIINHV